MVKIVYFATPKIALKTFETLVKSDKYHIQALVSNPSKAANRGKKVTESEIKKFALEHNIEVFEPKRISNEKEIISKLKALEPDFFITFAFGQILSQEVLDIPKHGTINLHASLLPKYRGADPIRTALLEGEKKTGITTMLTVLELDAGDICLCDEIELDEQTNSIELSNMISERSPALIQKTMDKILANELVPQEQSHCSATFTKKITKGDKEICWECGACQIHNKIRALVDNYTTHSTYKGKLVKFMRSSVVHAMSENKNSTPGEVLELGKDGIIIRCGEGAIILREVKPEGKGAMSAYSWSLGSGIKKGDKFGE